MKLTQTINDRILAAFDLRITRASSWRNQIEAQQRVASLAGSPVARDRILRLASLLTPQKAIGYSKVRIGSAHDGGYICLDDFAGIKSAFSFGIGHNDDWDIAIADKNIQVYQFDHTIQSPPHSHRNCHFERKKIVPNHLIGEASDSISSLLDKHANSDSSIILKMDIEHDEWDIFLSTSDADLNKFSQIICEFHGFAAIDSAEWYSRALSVLEKLHRRFDVVHIHPNNSSRWITIGNIPFPELVEVTYANRSRYAFEPTDESFPTSLDAPNESNRPELYLGPFLPISGAGRA
jgi:hypothetical protein